MLQDGIQGPALQGGRQTAAGWETGTESTKKCEGRISNSPSPHALWWIPPQVPPRHVVDVSRKRYAKRKAGTLSS